MCVNSELIRLIAVKGHNLPLMLDAAERMYDITEFTKNFHLVDKGVFCMVYPHVNPEAMSACLSVLITSNMKSPNAYITATPYMANKIRPLGVGQGND